MNRRTILLSTIVVVAAVAITHAAATLRIVPIVRDKSVIVSVELADAFTKEVRDSIASGLRTTITYDVKLKMEASVWVDRTIASAVVTTSDHYDNLTRVHNLSRTIDGRLVDALVTENEALARQWLTTLKELPLRRRRRPDSRRGTAHRRRAQRLDLRGPGDPAVAAQHAELLPQQAALAADGQLRQARGDGPALVDGAARAL